MPQLGTGPEPIVSSFIGWGDPLLDPAGAVGQLHFDAVLSEDHERTTLVTDHNVEQGINIVDHVRPNPDRLTLEVFISETPVESNDFQLLSLVLDLPQPDGGGNVFGQAPGVISGGFPPQQISATTYQTSNDFHYVQDAYNQLTTLRDTATLLSIATPKQFYSNMILETIRLRRDPRSGTSGYFTLEFRQIRVISSSIVAAPIPSVPRAAPTLVTGKKDPTQATAPKQSVLANLSTKSGLNLPGPAAGFPAPNP